MIDVSPLYLTECSRINTLEKENEKKIELSLFSNEKVTTVSNGKQVNNKYYSYRSSISD